MRPDAPETVAVPAPETETAAHRIPLRDITNIVEALDREGRTRPSLLPPAPAPAPATEGQITATAEETDPGKKPLASDQSTGTEACPLTDAAAAAADACSPQPVEISVPSLPPVLRVAHPSTGQSLQAATCGATASAAASRKRHPPKKATPPSESKDASGGARSGR